MDFKWHLHWYSITVGVLYLLFLVGLILNVKVLALFGGITAAAMMFYATLKA
jgi:hypothetical protein